MAQSGSCSSKLLPDRDHIHKPILRLESKLRLRPPPCTKSTNDPRVDHAEARRSRSKRVEVKTEKSKITENRRKKPRADNNANDKKLEEAPSFKRETLFKDGTTPSASPPSIGSTNINAGYRHLNTTILLCISYADHVTNEYVRSVSAALVVPQEPFLAPIKRRKVRACHHTRNSLDCAPGHVTRRSPSKLLEDSWMDKEKTSGLPFPWMSYC
ncbi:hypothetical protein DPMN_047627 [Dreissena polymorpha]|uniref:Uncharacterized protein n=1 Tax=Dreissena polymorpha TaxID=45954 RepID=A0A9D4D966_DREPO|nr:hypothetical protein DPMN_047627 [Dreissena polymorpha]